MQGKTVLILATGETLERLHDHPPTLEQFQSMVGGYIESVPMFDTYEGQDCVVFCNEEGKLKGLPFNEKATRAWYNSAGLNLSDALVGNVVIVMGDEEFMELV